MKTSNNNINFEKDSSSIVVLPIGQSIYKDLREIIDSNFDSDEEKYLNMDIDNYRKKVLEVQNQLINSGYPNKIAKQVLNYLQTYQNNKEILVQANVYLRASRPAKFFEQEAESIGFHREYFYGPGMEYSTNIWVPIRGVSKDNSLRYIPKSHEIPIDEVVVKKEPDKYTKRYSPGHSLGFQYSPKKIVGGVNLNNVETLNCEEGNFAIFSGNLVHGSASNNGDKIRFSIDFRIINKEYAYLTKKEHISAGNKPYFAEII